MTWAANYIGIPYKLHGRDRLGIDCWGLVRMVLKEQFDINVPSLDGKYEADDEEGVTDLIDETKALIKAEKVNTPLDGDIVVLRYLGYTTHVGIVVGDCILHASGVKMTALQKISSPHMMHRIQGYYRVS